VGLPPRLQRVPQRRRTLANGLTICLVAEHSTPIVDVEVVIRTGAARDAQSCAGRAAMVAEMLDEGSESRSVLEIADEIDYLGAHLGINAGWDSTLVALHVSSERLTPALEVLADVVLQPTFPVTEFERKQREKLTALRQERAEPRLLANKALTQGVFGSIHPYGAPAGGTYAAIEALTLEEVRSFYQQCYTPANTFIVAVGDIDFDDFSARLEQHFGGWQGMAPLPPAFPAEQAVERTHLLLVDKPGAAQAEIRVGHSAAGRNTPDYFPLIVLNTMLGGSFTSRLNLRLREEMGVTYGASSKFNLRLQGGLFWAGSAVDTDAAAQSVAVMLEEMRRFQRLQIDAEEMQRAAQYLAYGLPRHFEATHDIAAHIREQLLYHLEDDYWERFVERVLAVRPDDIAEVAARHLQPERAVAVVVADGAAVAPELERAGIGEVSKVDVIT
jgi:zinc protease